MIIYTVIMETYFWYLMHNFIFWVSWKILYWVLENPAGTDSTQQAMQGTDRTCNDKALLEKVAAGEFHFRKIHLLPNLSKGLFVRVQGPKDGSDMRAASPYSLQPNGDPPFPWEATNAPTDQRKRWRLGGVWPWNGKGRNPNWPKIFVGSNHFKSFNHFTHLLRNPTHPKKNTQKILISM